MTMGSSMLAMIFRARLSGTAQAVPAVGGQYTTVSREIGSRPEHRLKSKKECAATVSNKFSDEADLIRIYHWGDGLQESEKPS